MRKLIALVLVMVAVPVLALEYAVQQNGSVRFLRGSTPLPNNAVYPIPAELHSKPLGYLKVVDGKLAEKTAEEKAVMDLPEKYRKIDEVTGIWVEKTQEEKDAADAAEQAYKDALIAEWQAKKTNHVEIMLLDNRFLEVLQYANFYLMGEGIITNALTPANVKEDQMAFYIVSMTNQTVAAGLSSRLDTILRYDEKVTADKIGRPPDGSTVMSRIIAHPQILKVNVDALAPPKPKPPKKGFWKKVRSWF